MSMHKKRKVKQEKPQTTWELIKDLFTNPFEYRKKNPNNTLGKVLGGICIFLGLCLLFYITGNNF